MRKREAEKLLKEKQEAAKAALQSQRMAARIQAYAILDAANARKRMSPEHATMLKREVETLAKSVGLTVQQLLGISS